VRAGKSTFKKGGNERQVKTIFQRIFAEEKVLQERERKAGEREIATSNIQVFWENGLKIEFDIVKKFVSKASKFMMTN
jgi:hypothetical protein